MSQDWQSIQKKAVTPEYQIHDLLSKRWSPRAFAADPVEQDALLSLMEAARWAASSNNGQPWSFVVAHRADGEAFERMVSCLADGNVPWASQAPLLMIAVAKMTRASGAPHRLAYYDLGLAVENLTIQATALDLYVHQMGGFSTDRARELFEIPDGYEAATMLAVGYLGEPDSLGEPYRERELTPRERRPVSEFMFTGKWGATSR